MDTKENYNNIKSIEYCLLQPVSSVHDFLKDQFCSSGNKLKKYFSKSFLNRNLNEKQVLSLPLNFVNDGLISPQYLGTDLKILHEDENFFVFSKNANQHIHPLTYDEGDNCLSWIRQNRPELLSVNKKEYDRGLLYRLDYETSGVMIYAKSENLYQELREGFSELVREKIYKCWVEGHLMNPMDLKHSFTSSEVKGKRIIVASLDVYDRVGELKVKPISFNPDTNRTLVEVALKTGLRHQIRAQLAHVGFPLAGDTFYGGKEAARLYLHAFQYTIHFNGQAYFFESELHNFNGL